jgi:hypothetical protein
MLRPPPCATMISDISSMDIQETSTERAKLAKAGLESTRPAIGPA